ncbi:hypothetical protein [Microcoleus sp. POL10_C6]|uniref:hypothetical protein n=1 Tax=Microcoleus sp. POL10_C6 TaxID=2818852 RepID=UPI002FD378DA
MSLPQLQESENGLVTLCDFLSHQQDSIESGLKQAQIPHQIKFHPFDPDVLWKQGAFRVYVPPIYLKVATDLCISIEFANR